MGRKRQAPQSAHQDEGQQSRRARSPPPAHLVGIGDPNQPNWVRSGKTEAQTRKDKNKKRQTRAEKSAAKARAEHARNTTGITKQEQDYLNLAPKTDWRVKNTLRQQRRRERREAAESQALHSQHNAELQLGDDGRLTQDQIDAGIELPEALDSRLPTPETETEAEAERVSSPAFDIPWTSSPPQPVLDAAPGHSEHHGHLPPLIADVKANEPRPRANLERVPKVGYSEPVFQPGELDSAEKAWRSPLFRSIFVAENVSYWQHFLPADIKWSDLCDNAEARRCWPKEIIDPELIGDLTVVVPYVLYAEDCKLRWVHTQMMNGRNMHFSKAAYAAAAIARMLLDKTMTWEHWKGLILVSAKDPFEGSHICNVHSCNNPVHVMMESKKANNARKPCNKGRNYVQCDKAHQPPCLGHLHTNTHDNNIAYFAQKDFGSEEYNVLECPFDGCNEISENGSSFIKHVADHDEY
ncbi:hypothetical protein MBLNU457_g0884t1 [Dothideomycetes sp. NU457]